MSWNKNTINLSYINSTIEVLDNLKIRYELTDLGKVVGLGNNNGIFEENKYHTLRMLKYINENWKEVIILEQMQRIKSCDIDDLIISKSFTEDNVPQRWPLEIYPENGTIEQMATIKKLTIRPTGEIITAYRKVRHYIEEEFRYLSPRDLKSYYLGYIIGVYETFKWLLNKTSFNVVNHIIEIFNNKNV